MGLAPWQLGSALTLKPACSFASARVETALGRSSCDSPNLASMDMTTWQHRSRNLPSCVGNFVPLSPSSGTRTCTVGCGVVALVVQASLRQGLVRQWMVLVVRIN